MKKNKTPPYLKFEMNEPDRTVTLTVDSDLCEDAVRNFVHFLKGVGFYEETIKETFSLILDEMHEDLNAKLTKTDDYDSDVVETSPIPGDSL